MNTWTDYLQLVTYPGALFEVLLESLIVLAVAAAWCLVWRRAAAATKHLTWFLAVASLPCLLCLSSAPHFWPKPLWSLSTDIGSGNRYSVSLTLAPSRSSAVANSTSTDTAAKTGAVLGRAEITGQRLVTRFSAAEVRLVIAIWAGGSALGLIFVCAGQVQLRKLARKLKPFAAPEWDLAVRESCETLHLRRRPVLLQAAQDLMPVTWGWWRPIVLLPADAAQWPPQRRRVVLLHELAHVKRYDCLTQSVARVVCALFWVNPLVWVAARRMCIERERACDDLVLNGGCKPSDYATQLVEIARTFRHARYAAGIAMARPGQLQGRIAGIVDAARTRRLHPRAAVAMAGCMVALVACLAGTGGRVAVDTAASSALRQKQIAGLENFTLAKERQSQTLAASAGETIAPDFQSFFDSALRGDMQTVTNRYEYFKRHHPQYSNGTNAIERLRTPYWSPVLEICLAYDHVANCEPKYTQILAEGIIDSIPPGSIYFGGTDPGRGVPTAFEKSSIEGDPFFCLTQNALADGTYLDYLRAMYGGKIYTPTMNDSQNCFNEYMTDAQRRLKQNKLKPGEDVRMIDNQVAVSGQVAVMTINGLITKLIFDRNPGREFYIEESFPLDWMYPYLQPHGLIMRINRQPLPDLPEAVLAQDHEYWQQLVASMIGDRLRLQDRTSASDLAEFVNRVYVRKNLNGFSGDPLYIRNDYAKRIFSKLRSSIAGVYAWRLSSNAPAEFIPKSDAERQHLVQETDLAFRQAFALCPYSPEALFGYVNFLIEFNRLEDANWIVQASRKVDPQNKQTRDLSHKLQKMKGQ